MSGISTHQTEGAAVPSGAVSASERDRLVRLLALMPPRHRWAFEHRHTPLLCTLGVVDAPDEAYARAARRRFTDPSTTRKRALALLVELDREARAGSLEMWHMRANLDGSGH